MQFNRNFLRHYLRHAPMALAIERSLECEILSQQSFSRPILDLGCGDGLFARVLFSENVDTGIDSDQEEVERARCYAIYNELITCGGDRIPKDDESYHTVFSNSVLEHIPDLDPVLREVNRLLTPGGRFYASIPTDRFEAYSAGARLLHGLGLNGLARRYGAFYNRIWRHYNVHDRAGWQERFQMAGFKVVDVHSYDPPAICLINDLLVPLALPSLLFKKILHRWIISATLRRLYLGAVYGFARWATRRFDTDQGGGLILFHLTKP